MGTISKARQAEQAEEQRDAIEALRETFPPGSKAYTVLSHMSRSGMRRSIKVVAPAVVDDRYGQRLGILDVSWQVVRAVGWKFDRDHGGVIVDGAGMDMGFHLVYTLARVLYRDGFTCYGRENGCPSNDHTNGEDTALHRDGGYAIRGAWL